MWNPMQNRVKHFGAIFDPTKEENGSLKSKKV